MGISRGRARLGPIRHQGESQRTGDAHEIETRAGVVVSRCVCCYLYVQCRKNETNRPLRRRLVLIRLRNAPRLDDRFGRSGVTFGRGLRKSSSTSLFAAAVLPLSISTRVGTARRLHLGGFRLWTAKRNVDAVGERLGAFHDARSNVIVELRG